MIDTENDGRNASDNGEKISAADVTVNVAVQPVENAMSHNNDPLNCPKTVATVAWLKFGFAVLPMDGENKQADFGPASPFQHFQRYPDHIPAMRLPKNIVALVSEDRDLLHAYARAICAPPLLVLSYAGKYAALYHPDPADRFNYRPKLPPGINLVMPGKLIRLPWGEHLDQSRILTEDANSLFVLPFEVFQDAVDLTPKIAVLQPTVAEPAKVDDGVDEAEPKSELDAKTSEVPANDEVQHAQAPSLSVPEQPTILSRFSLRGKSEEIRKQIVDEMPLLDGLAISGQLSTWYGQANAGKTLIFMALLTKAITEGRIPAGNCYYFNADDSGSGLLVKNELMNDLGCHIIAPGYASFEVSMFDDLLTQMAENGQAKGTFVTLDTGKKFVDPLNKKDAARFATICRKFSLKGGTLLMLAHTNKYPNANGKQQYAGAADLTQDFDAYYTIDVLSDGQEEKVVEFTNGKARGDSALSAAYAFNNQPSLSYPERLASVREVDPEQLHLLQMVEAQANDAEVVAAITAAIGNGLMSKMELAVHVAGRVSIGRNKVVNILERYQGDNAAEHLWYFETGANGRKTYRLHGSAPVG